MSDQDFFFDEDEKPAPKSGGTKGTAAAKTSSPSQSDAAPVEAQSVTLAVAILIGIIGILLGVVVGLFIGKGMAAPAITATTTGAGAVAPAQSAPQLTEQQIQEGQLPEGHPQVGAGGSAETTDK